MARIFITGSTDGLGRLSAETLLARGHDVIVHARSEARGAALAPLVARGAQLVVGDLADLDAVRALAASVSALGPLDTVIHNAGVYSGPKILGVNVLAPYVLTARLPRPRRWLVLSSGLHRSSRVRVEQLGALDWHEQRGPGSYADSKLFVTTLAFALARRWPGVACHAIDPGWVPTKMGGPSAPDDLALGHATQDALADEAPLEPGYWHHQTRRPPHRAALDVAFQDALLEALTDATGVALSAT